MMRRALWLTMVLCMVLFGACGSDDQPAADDVADEGAAAEISEVSLVAKDYSYDAPKTIKAGTTELTMENEGKEAHIAVVAKIAEGKTLADVTKALQTPPGSGPGGPPPFEESAGIASTGPGLSSNVTFDLEAGSYLLFCFLPSPDGAPHFTKGMLSPFEVTAAEDEVAPLPEADATVTAKDFAYATELEAKAGDQVIEFTNEGTQTHEANLVELPAGKTPADLAAWLAKPEGPPPATFLGGPIIKKGASATWKTPSLTAGKSYAFICLIPDPADKVPHLAKGMALPVTVT